MYRPFWLALMIALLFAVAAGPAMAQAPAAVVNGGGHAILRDPDGNTFPVQFAIAGIV